MSNDPKEAPGTVVCLRRCAHQCQRDSGLSALAWSNGYDVRFTRERFRVRSSVRVYSVDSERVARANYAARVGHPQSHYACMV